MNPIYLDYNATTPIDKQVASAMRPYLDNYFGNPSSTHEYGIITKKALIKARKQIADLINCKPDEIIFTSGGTESNNYAIKGVAMANREKGNHIITTKVEHPAVIEVCKYLEDYGFSVTYVEVDKDGWVDPEEIKRAILPETVLITVMHANNEVGTIQPIESIGSIAKEYNIPFHTDAAQSLGKIDVDVQKLGVDLLSVAGHKLYAPKGIGALYVRHGLQLEKLIHGADHEMNKRAGTENVLEVVGLGEACAIAKHNFNKSTSHLQEMRDRLYQKLYDQLPDVKINGHQDNRLPNTLSISFPGVEANTLLSELTQVAASAGAACHTDSIDISSVLEAMKIPEIYAMGTIRFSTGRFTTVEEIDQAVKYVVEAVNRLKGSAKEELKQGSDEVRLTQFTHGLGCACKIRPQYLEQILHDMPDPTDPDVLVSLASSDDAAVYKINEETAIIQSVDFFTPIVDDPYHFGSIAAANALSDIYAMGGKPLFALNIVGFPDNRLPAEVLKQILKGASDKAAEAGIYILGGHTVEDPEPKFGMSVTGSVDPRKIIRNNTAQVGDVLILTKPIGTGIISTAVKRGIASDEIKDITIQSMSALNDKAAEVMKDFPVSACTDITGFGLLGHLSEMVHSAKLDVRIEKDKVPVMEGVEDFVANNIVPGGTLNNMSFVEDVVEYDDTISHSDKIVLNDAQTSGGLLISISEQYKQEVLDHLHRKGLLQVQCIGKVVKNGVGKIIVV